MNYRTADEGTLKLPVNVPFHLKQAVNLPRALLVHSSAMQETSPVPKLKAPAVIIC
jgi:hypothetical protein